MEYISIDALYFTASTILAVIFFYLGIWYNKRLLNKFQLSFVINEWLPLVTRAKDFQFLQLRDYLPPQDTNVYYLKAIIANTGNQDIEKEKIYKSLNIDFPEGYNISKTTYFSDIEDIDIVFSSKNNSIEISWNLLKPNETIHLELIIETVENISQPDLEKKIKLRHRILNVNSIKVFSIYPDNIKYYKDWIKMSYFMMIGSVFVFSIWEYLIYRNFKNATAKISYTLKYKDIGIVENFHHINDSILKFTIKNKDYYTKVDDIAKNFEILTSSDVSKPSYLGVLILFLIMFSFSLIIHLDLRKNKKQAELLLKTYN